MPTCLVCDSPSRTDIDRELAQWDALTAVSNGDAPSIEATCIRLQGEYGKGKWAFTLPEMLDHARSCKRYVEPEVEESSQGIIQEVVIKGETYSVPSDELVKAHIMAAGVKNIIDNPTIVKPNHLIALMKIGGGGDFGKALVDFVSRALVQHDPKAEGPAKPPDV
jgi:hypothetical protein